jgi:hypothetical protein
MKRILRNRCGLTISELMVVVLLSSIAAGIIYTNFAFINKSAVLWRKNSGYEQEIDRLVSILDYELQHLTSLDTVNDKAIFYHDKKGTPSEMIFSKAFFKERYAFCDSTLTKIEIDSVKLEYLSTDLSRDKDKNNSVDVGDLDRNLNGRLDKNEVASVDYIIYKMRFRYGSKDNQMNIKSENRLLSKFNRL